MIQRFKVLLSSVFLLAFVSLAVSQTVITGSVYDESSVPVEGANVMVQGTNNSTETDSEGMFSLNVEPGEGVVEISDLLGTQQISYDIANGETKDLGMVTLSGEGVTLGSLVVVGKGVIDLEEDRQTPVAVSTILKEEIEEKAQGNVEFPEVMANTPNIYVSNQAGGFGDSQMFTRGFDQSNTAFLLNGQPINGMEDGKMYWSNWSGMTEIANAVQVQRGLGSSKLAISSVGGTVNIVTKSTEKRRGGYAQGIVGNDSYFKFGAGYDTGLSERGWAFSFALSYWQGWRKYARGTAGAGQNYFVGIGKKLGKHNLNFLLTGAPQWHDQNYTKENYDNGLGYDAFGRKWNPNAGFKDGEAFTWRKNYYHKPIANLNWDWNISPDMNLSTVLYASWGRGGGTGPFGDTRPFDYFRGPSVTQYYDSNNGGFLFDKIVEENQQVENGAGSFGNGTALRSSVNNHNWYGLVSNFNYEVNENFSFNVGFDGRLYKGDHFRQLVDLLGLNSFEDTYLRDDSLGDNVVSDTFDANPWASLFNYADKDQRVGYDYSENINYIGGFGQAEYATEKFSLYFQGAISTQSYKREGRWSDLGDSEKVSKFGYNVKGGAAYKFNKENSIYANAGYYSRQPFLDNIFNDVRYSNNLVTPEVENEEITGFEVGYKLTNDILTLSLNGYYTKWGNRFIGQFRDDFSTLLSGVTQLHKGLELDWQAKPSRAFKLNGYIAFGDWTYDGDADYRKRNEQTNEIVETGNSDLTGIKVGQAPQFNTGMGFDWNLTKELSWDVDFNYYGKFFGFVDIEEAAEAEREGTDYRPEILNNYALVNTGATYKFKFGRQSLKLRANVRNLFNHQYISQQDQYGWLWGIGRTWNMGITWDF